MSFEYPPSWLTPDWPAPVRVNAIMTDRRGGVSAPPWDSMNLGDHVGDLPANVALNRQYLHAATQARPVFLRQVHGVQVVKLNADSPNDLVADACISVDPQVACTVMVADCLPVLLCDTAGRWVAAAHAGWRGLAGEGGQGVLEHVLHHTVLTDTPDNDILVWLGPCIGPQQFEVGPDVRAAFCELDPQAAGFFKPRREDKWWADLAGLARWRLLQQGVHRIFGNDGSSPWCTVTQSSSFFSHRRDNLRLGQSGRMAACIWLSPGD